MAKQQRILFFCFWASNVIVRHFLLTFVGTVTCNVTVHWVYGYHSLYATFWWFECQRWTV